MRSKRGFSSSVLSAALAVTAGSLVVAGCADDDSIAGPDAAVDAGTDADSDSDDDADAGADAGPTNAALVFEVDPFVTPSPIQIDLADVADDADGSLVTAAREDGVRRIRVLSCLDVGETNTNPLTGEAQRICTLSPVADKETNGSFLYDDYDGAAACIFDADDASAEVNAYFHATKIYDLVTAPEVGVFELLPGRHFVGGAPVPLTVVVNYREPVPASQASSLPPTDYAFFLSREYLAMGMSVFQGLVGIPGDVLAFGQGAATDFAYSGQTIYHEFGHALTNATAGLGQIVIDAQGMTDQPAALDEAIANTMAFIGSGEPLSGEFLSDCSGYDFLFDAEDDAVFPDDATGHPVVDGNPVLAANWDLETAIVESWGGSQADFLRALLLALEDLAALGGEVLFADYADALLSQLSDGGFDQHAAEALAILAAHGLTSTGRVVDLTGGTAEEYQYLYMGCAADEMWNTVMPPTSAGASCPSRRPTCRTAPRSPQARRR